MLQIYEKTTVITLDPSLSYAVLQKDLKRGGEAGVFQNIFILGWFKREHFNASRLP